MCELAHLRHRDGSIPDACHNLDGCKREAMRGPHTAVTKPVTTMIAAAESESQKGTVCSVLPLEIIN